MASHSKIVGGSTAKRVMLCPGSVALCKDIPRKSSSYADEGTLLHTAISQILVSGHKPETIMGMTYEGSMLTQELIDDKLLPALAALDDIDPEGEMDIEVEAVVDFGSFLPGVFGSADLLGRLHNRAVVLDWKFGSGVAVEVEENAQLMFYAAAAMRTPAVQWVFEGAEEVELIIVQPPSVKRGVTTKDRIQHFEKELAYAVTLAKKPDAKLAAGEHCRFCPAKPVCPVMTGALDRALAEQIATIDTASIGARLSMLELLESYAVDLRALAHDLLEKGTDVPGWKLVNKRATRQWVDEAKAQDALKAAGLTETELTETKMISPAKAETALKKRKVPLPEGIAVAVSSGSTLAPESDPRPSVLQIGQQITAALAKMVN